MGKVKNLEKKDKTAAEFDKKNPSNRVKSINDDKQKKKLKQKSKVTAVGGAVEKEVKPLVKEAKKEIEKALKAKEKLLNPKVVVKKEETADDLPAQLATRDVIKKAVKAAKEGLEKEKESATAKDLFDEETRIGLQVVASKIPKTPPHTKKILLTHSIFGDAQLDICFIIRDGKSKKSDSIVDETVQKFEEKLRELDINNVKTILTVTKLKKDYGTNNMKLKLLNTFDLFFVESEIAEHVYTILGKHFIKKRKRPLQVDTSKTEIMKISMENGARKVSFKVSANSNLSAFEVGTLKMENSKIVDNVVAAIDQLKEKWPGGWKNILRVYLKPMTKSKISIPLYYSKISPNDVEIPVEVGAKQTRLDRISEQLAKKTKKLKINRKTKRIEKVRGEAPVKGEKSKKKKEKSEAAPAVEETKVAEETPKPEESKPKKKKKKHSESEAPAPAAEEPQKKKKKKAVDSEPVAVPAPVEETKKSEKKKKKSAEPAPEVEVVPEKASKKKNKKKKDE